MFTAGRAAAIRAAPYAAAGAAAAGNAVRLGLDRPLSRPAVFNQTLSNIVNSNLFKLGDRFPGGTAGAIRETLRTGRLIGGTDHITPGLQRVQALDNVLARGGLNVFDRLNAIILRQDLVNALTEAGVKVP